MKATTSAVDQPNMRIVLYGTWTCYHLGVSRRCWLILGIAVALLASRGARSTARAEPQSGEKPVESPVEEPVAGPSPFLDGLSWQLLVSSYYMFNAHRVAGPYNDLGYPYADTMGFGLVFAGGDVAYRA
ncbi:MAG: hypothetical protein WBN01_20835, partial [Polyangiales bacterium]